MALRAHLAYKYKFVWPIEGLTFLNYFTRFRVRRFHIKTLISVSPFLKKIEIHAKLKDGMVLTWPPYSGGEWQFLL